MCFDFITHVGKSPVNCICDFKNDYSAAYCIPNRDLLLKKLRPLLKKLFLEQPGGVGVAGEMMIRGTGISVNVGPE